MDTSVRSPQCEILNAQQKTSTQVHEGKNIAIYLYEVGGNPIPCDEFKCTAVHGNNTFLSYTKLINTVCIGWLGTWCIAY